MKKSIAIIAALLTAALSVTGCVGTKEPAPEPQTTVAEAPATEEPTTAEPATEEPVPQEYTAVQLAGMSLSEIIDLMGGDYEVEINGSHTIHYTSDAVCLMNFDKLPGFAFFVDTAPSSESAVKAEIESGAITEIAFIGVYDSAKYDDRISADMHYNAVSEVLGSYDLLPMAGAEITSQSIPSSDSAVRGATVYYDSRTASVEAAQQEDPAINGIAVFPQR